MSSERTSPLHLVGAALSGGLFGGSAVGIAEAAWVLGSSTPAEYQAVGYGATLYGLIGGAMGAGIGVVAAGVGMRTSVPRWLAWFAGAWSVVFALGTVILRYVVNKSVYAEQGVPMATMLGIVGGLAVAGLLKGWIARMLLTKTPLQVLPTVKGTFAGWGALVGLGWLFSMAPAPGAKASLPAASGSREGRPDVLVVLIDTLRADALGVYGAGPEASPNLDAFAKDAVLFEQHVTSASWTRASTASLFTSMSPSSHACETKDAALPQMVVTMAEALKQGGYRTGGLPNNANVTGAQGFDQGYDWFPYAPQYPLMASESTYALSLYAAVRKAWTKVDTKKRVESYYMPAETQLARGKAFLDAGKDGGPSLLFVHLMEPHDPYFKHPWDGTAYGRAEFPNPDPSKKDELRALYAGEVKHADEELGKLFAQLKAEGRYDDMVIVVTADHGEEFLEHGGWWHGTTLYDEQVRTPLLVKLPKNARAGVRVPWQVRQIDVAPTLAELAGVEVPATWQGTTLFDDRFDEDLAKLRPPEIEDPEDPAERVAVASFVAPTWVNHPASRDALSEQDFEGYDLQALRGKGRKLIQALRVPKGNYRDQPPLQVFDLQADAAEQQNLAGTGVPWEGAVAAQLESLVEQRREVRVAEEGAAMSDAERARLEALGYLQGEDAEKK